MSRTFKDQPYWVKQNQPNRYAITQKHNHARLGENYVMYERKIISTETVSVEHKETRIVPIFASEYWKVDTTQLKPYLISDSKVVMWCLEETVTKKWAYKKFIIEITETIKTRPIECTLYEPRVMHGSRREKLYMTTPCYFSLERWQLGFKEGNYQIPKKYERSLSHSRRRRKHKVQSKIMTKLYNSGEDIESYNYDGLKERNRPGRW